MSSFKVDFRQNHSHKTTIAAIATPPGEGGVAIIRISGPQAFQVAQKLFSVDAAHCKSHSVYYGWVLDEQGRRLDDGLLLPFRSPRSYTGEDIVELHCHGGNFIARRVLELALSAGALPAQAGEFTMRAFLNGKIDLAQAEAVQQLIGARNEYALQSAKEQLEGRLSKAVSSLQKELTHCAAVFEAWVDFPEEGLEFATLEEMSNRVLLIKEQMQKLLATFEEGRVLRDGAKVALIGPPNAGKSSLLNALLERERAIVSAIPGTTRDLIEEQANLLGMQLQLIDTAGIRQSDEVIEQEGMRRSLSVAQEADLLLLLFDSSQPLTQEHFDLIEKVAVDKTLLLWNKVDLVKQETSAFSIDGLQQLYLSVKERKGIDELKQAVRAKLAKSDRRGEEGAAIANMRHKKAVEKACCYCDAVLAGLKSGLSAEFVALDMKSCLSALGEVIGTDVTEDILSAIFATFCVGK